MLNYENSIAHDFQKFHKEIGAHSVNNLTTTVAERTSSEKIEFFPACSTPKSKQPTETPRLSKDEDEDEDMEVSCIPIISGSFDGTGNQSFYVNSQEICGASQIEEFYCTAREKVHSVHEDDIPFEPTVNSEILARFQNLKQDTDIVEHHSMKF
ncbi:hypothetical protein SNEBB_006405 [Seison nebaliae]|nr:hypothetical protein SNEBB_006405 [Seison nebaliae]